MWSAPLLVELPSGPFKACPRRGSSPARRQLQPLVEPQPSQM